MEPEVPSLLAHSLLGVEDGPAAGELDEESQQDEQRAEEHKNGESEAELDGPLGLREDARSPEAVREHEPTRPQALDRDLAREALKGARCIFDADSRQAALEKRGHRQMTAEVVEGNDD
jgi:hypothetical protein